ncbi:MAG: D-alanyl-D-alanine carboxypeptidase [Gammaproteobacteria bacterium]|nr:D-alanyl-D-alanine carboxypeptidase [Gammaproteobacteria bacterium]MCZ6669390.1 D-alanyl-D-alanine carboxypeptidase [Gammaproteobacteria bacterium]MCZ6723174.1 D-alanyl-D-alanine carboxypeptidase [Gammaproteobacteria bacterium]
MKIDKISFLILFALLSTAVGAAPKPIPDPPSLKADSYFLLDFDSGRVLAEKNPDKHIEPASITKLMTAYLVDKAIADGDITADELVTISEKAWRMKGSKMFVEVGRQITVADLLKGLIIQSGNDASIALAEHVAGSESAFAGYMNHQAGLLGMTNTSFKNATGWPVEGHYSSARDIAILTRAVIRDFPETYRIYKEKEYTFNEIRQYNRNRLLWRDDTVDGVKTGHTEAAGYCLVASALRGKMRLISVVIGASSDKARTQSSQALLNYGYRFFETHRLYRANEVLKTARVWYGDREQVAMGVANDIHITIPRGRYQELEAAMEIDSEISAPIRLGQELGMVTVKLDDEVIVNENIVATQAINDGGLLVKALDSIKLMFR